MRRPGGNFSIDHLEDVDAGHRQRITCERQPRAVHKPVTQSKMLVSLTTDCFQVMQTISSTALGKGKHCWQLWGLPPVKLQQQLNASWQVSPSTACGHTHGSM